MAVKGPLAGRESEDRLNVLVTRSEPGASRTAKALEGMGFQPIVSPLLVHRALLDDDNCLSRAELTAARALAFTSEAAIIELVRRNLIMPDISVYCVGAATAQAARQAGFRRVVSAEGDVSDLAACLVADFAKEHSQEGCQEPSACLSKVDTGFWDKDSHKQRDRALSRLHKSATSSSKPADFGEILHLSGRHVAGDLVGELIAHGLAARRVILYEMAEVGALSQEAERLIETGDIAAALFHSPRGAALFTALTNARFRCDHPGLAKIQYFALSTAIAQALERSGAALSIAANPSEDNLLNCLRRATS